MRITFEQFGVPSTRTYVSGSLGPPISQDSHNLDSRRVDRLKHNDKFKLEDVENQKVENDKLCPHE